MGGSDYAGGARSWWLAIGGSGRTEIGGRKVKVKKLRLRLRLLICNSTCWIDSLGACALFSSSLLCLQ